MLRPNYCILEHANTLLSVITLPLVERYANILFKETIYFFQKKVFLLFFKRIYSCYTTNVGTE